MCLIVVKNQANASFSMADCKASYNRNSDGTGIMYIENGRVVVEKTASKTMKDHMELYYKHMNRPQFVLHHRLGTSGEKTELNVHPFCVLNIDEGDPYDLYFCHNGVFSMHKFSTDHDKKFSDTNLFCQEYLRPLMKKYPDIIEQAAFQSMLHDFLGTNNKLAFLRNDGMIYVFNRQQGDEHNGCWLSNKYSISSSQTYTYGKNHGAKTAYDYYNNGWPTDEDTDDKYVQDNGIWRKNWNEANVRKQKAADSMSNMSADEIMESIETYAGLQEKDYEELFIEEPHLVYDMINFLEIGNVDTGLINEDAKKVATQLHDLMQGYLKKKAA